MSRHDVCHAHHVRKWAAVYRECQSCGSRRTFGDVGHHWCACIASWTFEAGYDRPSQCGLLLDHHARYWHIHGYTFGVTVPITGIWQKGCRIWADRHDAP